MIIKNKREISEFNILVRHNSKKDYKFKDSKISGHYNLRKNKTKHNIKILNLSCNKKGLWSDLKKIIITLIILGVVIIGVILSMTDKINFVREQGTCGNLKVLDSKCVTDLENIKEGYEYDSSLKCPKTTNGNPQYCIVESFS